MAAPTICALLLVIGALVAPVRLQSDPCNTANPTTTGVPFNLTVAPGSYSGNTSYTVTVTGRTNFTSVQLQAVDSSTNMTLGTWTGGSGTISCGNSSFLSNSSSMSFTAQWTSPGTSQSVEIRAYITDGSSLYMTKQALLTVLSTAAPMSPNATGSNITTPTNAPGSNQTATSPSTGSSASQNASTVTQTPASVTATKPTSTTTSGSDKSMYSSSILIAAIQVVFLLFVNGRQTS